MSSQCLSYHDYDAAPRRYCIRQEGHSGVHCYIEGEEHHPKNQDQHKAPRANSNKAGG